jgi:hypothetical protein
MPLPTFSPRAEQFESKLLLAADISWLPSEHVNNMPAEVQTVWNTGIHDSNRTLRTDRMDGAIVLVVQFTDAQTPRVLHIAGGESATTQGDGSARLRLPLDVEMIDLSIRDLLTDQVSVIRLELKDGQILKQWTLTANSDTDMNPHSNVVIPNHSSSLHTPIGNASLFSNTDDWTHGLLSEWDHGDSLTGSKVDAAMAHESDMPMSSASVRHAPSTAGYSSRQHAPAVTDSAKAVDVAETMTAGHGADVADPADSGPTTASENSEVETFADENIETILANWTSGQPLPLAPAFSRNPIVPVFTEALAISPDHSTDAMKSIVLVSYVSGDEISPASELSELNHWPFAGALVVSAVAAGSAFALHRRAERLLEKPLEISPLSAD